MRAVSGVLWVRGVLLATLFLGLNLAVSGCDEPAAPQAAKKTGKKTTRVHLVETVNVENRSLGFEAVRTGTLAARKSVRVFNQEEGRIDRIDVREGDKVRAGQVIVQLDRRLLRAELAKAKATRAQAEADVARVRELMRRKVTTQERLDKAQTALSVAKAEEVLIRTRLDYAQIKAPFAGVVVERNAEPGDIAPRHSHLLTVIDPTSLYTDVSVSELVLPRLRVGDTVQVRIDALGAGSFSGRIGRLHPTIDPRTRQGTVEVELAPVPTGAAAGQLCRVILRAPEVPRRVIPFAALRNNRDGTFVYVVEDGKAQARAVRVGLRFDSQVEILDGLVEGQPVVMRGFLGLSDGKAVSISKASQPSSAGS